MSRVDVVIPCYRYAHFLRACVKSVLDQAGVDVRVLVIDDCSPDNTPEVGNQLAAEDKRVEFRRHEVNKGHIATYNEGLLGWASGDYVLLLSADDLLTPGALARAAGLMDRHPEVGFTYGRAIATDKPDYGSVTAPAEYRSRVLTGAEFWQLSCATATNLVATPTLVARTSLQQGVGGYRADLPHTGDLEMVMRFAAHMGVGLVDADQAFYRVHGDNMHKTSFPSAFTVLHQHKLAFSTLFEQYGDRMPDREKLWSQAMRGTAIGAVKKASRLYDQGDAESCDKLLAEALATYPALKGEKEWARLRYKRMFGAKAMRFVEGTYRGLKKCLGKGGTAVHDPSPFGRSGIFNGV